MARFDILANGVLIGRTDLEMGDPVKGIVAGSLEPTPEYASIHAIENLKLSVRLAGGDGLLIDGVVTIEDYSAEIGSNYTVIEVTVTGISEQTYNHFFPTHVAVHESHSRV